MLGTDKQEDTNRLYDNNTNWTQKSFFDLLSNHVLKTDD